MRQEARRVEADHKRAFMSYQGMQGCRLHNALVWLLIRTLGMGNVYSFLLLGVSLASGTGVSPTRTPYTHCPLGSEQH